MSKTELPREKGKGAEYPYFPTKQQLFIFRNWESVSKEKMAQVLKTKVEVVEKLASQMGLDISSSYNEQYSERGYITLIRNNWNILPYEQLMEILSYTEEELAFTLKEEDFLNIKLGNKPELEPVVYRPLTKEEEKQTEKIKKCIEENFGNFREQNIAEDFDFIDGRYYKKNCINSCSLIRKVKISNKWGIIDYSGKENTKIFVENFKKEIFDTWQIKLEGQENFIILKTATDIGEMNESHIVNIKENEIVISAHDEFGILRGLEYIKRKMFLSGNPSLDEKTIKRDTQFDIRFIYSYHALYGDPFLDGCSSSYPNELLKAYSEVGINGVWVQAVLYRMFEFPWDASISKDWEKRIVGLNDFVNRAAGYGIKVYLYINEPRSMPKSFFKVHPELLGCYENDFGSLCTSLPEVKQYVKDGVRHVCRSVPDIGGFFTITSSENLTNCHSRKESTVCERCADIEPYKVYAEINSIIAEAAHEVNPDITVIAWNWGWDDRNCDVEKITAALKDKDVRIMCTSEEGVSSNIGGVDTAVIDYSISLTGPGDVAKGYWKECKKRGIKTLAKVQFNNTWECSVVPYIPTFDLVFKHMEGIMQSNVDGLMLGWTLGGFPSVTLEMVSKYYWKETVISGDASEQDIYKEVFGRFSETVKKASKKLSAAFENYPFALRSLYLGPQQMGPANLLFEKATGLEATMTGFPYDDLENWRSIFPIETYENQFYLLSKGFREGLNLLKNCTIDKADEHSGRFKELIQITTAITCIYESCYNQIAYIRLRDSLSDLADNNRNSQISIKIRELLQYEKNIAKELFNVMIHNSTIGYEAANQYFFNKFSIMEKVICCDYLIEKFR